MRLKSRNLTALVLPFIALVSCKKETAAPTPEAPKPADSYPLTTCVVCGEPLGGDIGEPVVYDYNGTTVKFCCKSCIPKFERANGEQVEVGEDVHSPQRPRLAAGTKGTQEFGKDQRGEGERAGHFQILMLQGVRIDAQQHAGGEQASEEHRAEEATVGDALVPRSASMAAVS